MTVTGDGQEGQQMTVHERVAGVPKVANMGSIAIASLCEMVML